MKRLYVIGDKQTGVVLVTLDPLRAALVSLDEIKRFAQASGRTVDQVFGFVAEGAQRLIVRNVKPERLPNDEAFVEGIRTLVESGATVTDADFCMIADLPIGAEWETKRNPYPPLKQGLEHLALGTGLGGEAFLAQLVELDNPAPPSASTKQSTKAAKSKGTKATQRKGK